jgi:hypothetical protein
VKMPEGVMFRALLILALITPALSEVTLNDLVDAARWYSAAIRKQTEIVQNVPPLTEFAAMTIDYAQAKAAYFEVLAKVIPELTDIAAGRKARPPELDNIAKTFSLAGEEQKKAVDRETLRLLKRFDRNPEIEKAQSEFIRAQKIEEDFRREFDGIEFTSR